MADSKTAVGRPAKLSAALVAKVKEPGRYGDGRGGYGLSLLVKPRANGGLRKVWCQRLRINGKLVDLGLGAYPIVTLAEARAAALANRRATFKGIDPRATGIPTFEEAAERVIRLHEPNWRNGAKSADQWRASLRDYALPRIGKMPLDKIMPQDVLACLTPIWNDKRETARRVRQRIQAVMRWAVAQNYRADDPVAAISAALPKNGGKKQHFTALPWQAVGDALNTIAASDAYPTTALAMRFVALTAARSGEARLARWTEIDGDTWTIPGERMKAGREHRVPLSEAALAVLEEAKEYADSTGLIFPSAAGKAMSDSTLSKLCRETGIGCVPHGFRSSFRQWAADTGKSRELAEMALAHTVRGVEGAYQRSDILERRRELMDAWAAQVSA